MGVNIIGRYVWLVDTLCRHKRLTFQEISNLWQESGLGYGDPLPLRTFHHHQRAIKDIFDVYIECDRRNGYQYYIDNPQRLEGSALRKWLVSSYATLNQIQADHQLEGRIIFEDIPSGQTWLTHIAAAMRGNRVLRITYRGFGRAESTTFEIEPYCLKVVRRRWYVVARCPYYARQNKMADRPHHTEYRVYALDRISDIADTEQTFSLSEDFDPQVYFAGCCGVMTSEGPVERVVVRAYGAMADYLRTLPLHESQQELEVGPDSVRFAYRVKPTLDFYQLLLAQGSQLEVVEPAYVRREMQQLVEELAARYRREPEEGAAVGAES